MTQNGQGQCRKCEQCLKRKRRHWLGRLAAEAFYSDHVRFVTLTYSDEHVGTAHGLPNDHMKEYFNTLRRRYAVKHFTVGEYGELKGRPHWHSIQFFYGSAPDFPLNFSTVNYGWKKGNSQYEIPRSIAGSLSYLYDYLDKGGKGLRPSHGMGKQYLLNHSVMMARNKRAMTDDFGLPFTVPGVNKKTGGAWKYYIPSGHHFAAAMVDAYIEEYLAVWGEHPDYDRLNKVKYG